ncbi:MAG: hypothetical protein SHS37scaffold145_8 [Phage 71_18]|nr:MAG: hypothetical protein SHS37scaffold145_8 [Phage 71_18]
MTLNLSPSWWCEEITFIDPSGIEYVLTSQDDHAALEGIAGRGMPPIRISDEIVPMTPGARLRDLQHGVRDVAVPIAFYDDDLVAVRAALRGVMRTFDPRRGDGTLRVLTVDGIERDLTCRYQGGFEIVEAPPDRGISPTQAAQRGVLVFRAFDPYWYDVEAFTEEFTLGAAGGSFFPIPNPTTGSFITLTASEVFTTVTIDLDTDLDDWNWPVWTITGPGSAIVLRNLTTGDDIDLTANGGLTLDDGEVATLDLRPGVKTLMLADGTNLYPYLTNASVLWPLGPTQQVQIEMTGATVDTLVELSVNPAHLSV